MKFNWGTGIFIVIVVFIITMIGIIIFSFNQKINLVTPEYYPKGVVFEEHITKVKNTKALKEKIKYIVEDNKIVISFPDKFKGKKISGTIQFYYVADFEKDSKFKLKPNENLKQEFLVSSFNSGRYILKIDWKDGKKEYYQEFDLTL